MRSPRLLAALCLLLAASCRLGAAARHGCLLEKKLCPTDQLCSDDGLFGRCQAPHQEPVRYRVSVPVLHRLQEVLKELMAQGLTWRDGVTQAVVGRELSRVPAAGPRYDEKQMSRPPGPGQRRVQGPEDPADPGMMQQYLDYMVLDPPRASAHMQAPRLDPSTGQQLEGNAPSRQEQSKYQEQEERSLNSLDPPGFPLLAAPPRSRGDPLERDRQLLQDLVSFYLTSSSSSSSSSSPVQSLSRHRGAVAAAAGFPSSLSSSSSSSSSSSFFPELDFPLDYSEDYVSQVAQLSKQQQEEKKEQEEYDAVSGLDERSVHRLAQLLRHYGLDLKDLTPEQRDDLPVALKQLGGSSTRPQVKDKYENNAATRKKVTEGSMAFKMAAPEAPPSTNKPPEPEGPPPPAAADRDEPKPAKEFGFIVTNQRYSTSSNQRYSSSSNQSAARPSMTFRVRPNTKNLPAAGGGAKAEKNDPESETGLRVLQSGGGERTDGEALPLATRVQPRSSRWLFAALVATACMGSVLVGAMTVVCLRRHAHRLAKRKLGLGPEGGSFTHQEYQDLCRQHMASKGAFGRLEAAALGAVGGAGGGGGGADSRVSSVSSQFSDGAQPSPSSHSSTPSWCEEPAQANMDISTGHMILAYMEDHLRNKDRLMKEWVALCSYQAEPSAVSQSDANAKKNRCPAAVPYDHSRVKLKAEVNASRSDYINASTIIEHDPRMPVYIATQGPLSHTISDFWQMVWENGCTVIVMMTALVEDGEKQCARYWPDEGASLYHIYEVNLVSEHIWCNDFLVRSFYLKNVQTQETRTLTQFHFLSWPAQGIPTATRPLLDFRRKVNKCYRGRSCPIIVHCSNGTGRTGTYILIDMVLNRMAKGVKEIDIAATLEHVRDQRPGMVRTKDQFEFALTAVAEEVNAILKALPQ
ncbi:receptor-type tyrosine-protein phosphatase-like N isoform X2 [Pseudoliparis swirei]|uniref:receptor-type tyrosine-protein phosphatase-like N isoform X2 n=1 Tax=Pseudoliparis swirei TaxID=2059687 RepID=UPI0024BD9429|nr:receptor-type tyrosine-protein phosphatase-like N isoform X2 [Pseudoliparis swirei]